MLHLLNNARTVLECSNISLVGDGFCNDETNHFNCNYDGGDCCLNDNKDYCSECVCYLLETCMKGFHPLVGNGFFDPITSPRITKKFLTDGHLDDFFKSMERKQWPVTIHCDCGKIFSDNKSLRKH